MHSPETDNVEDIKYWLQFSMYYRWPHITYFSSWAELFDKLTKADFIAIHQKMKMENIRRLESSRNAYKQVRESKNSFLNTFPE